MRKVKFLIFVIFLVSTGFSWKGKTADRFWVSFVGGPHKYLMLIDEVGNVVRPAKRLSELGSKRFSPLTALSRNGPSSLNLWFIWNIRKGKIIRMVIDKETLSTNKLITTRFPGAYPDRFATIDVTNRKTNNFISYLTLPENPLDEVRLIAHTVDDSSHIVGRSSFLSPENVCLRSVLRCKSGVTEDGRLLYWTAENSRNSRRTDLYIRPLGPRHHPVLDPVYIDSITAIRGGHASVIYSVDATNKLADQSRFLVYTKQPAAKQGTLILQRIDGLTGQKIGSPVTLFKAILFPPGLKVDPKGRFVVFMVEDAKIGFGLAVQVLDATGHASGSPRLLTDLAVSGIDLLQEF